MPLLSSDSARYCVLPRTQPPGHQPNLPLLRFSDAADLSRHAQRQPGRYRHVLHAQEPAARHRQPGLHVAPVNRNSRLHCACLWLGARPLEPVRPAGSRLFSLLRAYSGRLVSLDAFYHLSYSGLFLGSLFVTLSFRSIAAAHQALLALIGQQKLMTGRLTTLWQVVSYIPMGASAFISGWVAVHLPPRPTFFADGGAGFGHRLPRVLEAGLRFSRHL